jgi:hypothetical protein
MRSSIAAVLLLILVSSPALAETYTVFPDGSGDFPTIQAAVDAIDDGDVIELADGTFTGDGNRDIDFLGKAITIRAQSADPELCVIDCEGSESDPHRGFSFRSGEQAGSILMGVKVIGGWGVYPETGGAILCEGAVSPTFLSCLFAANTGSAVGCIIGPSPTFTDCRFLNNQGEAGAAIYSDRSTLMITGCEFTENVAEGEAAAIFAYSTEADLTECTFRGNTAYSAAAVSFHDGSEVNILDCLFESNSSLHNGAALTFWLSGPNRVERCTFIGNTAGSEGAALWSEKVSDTYVGGCTFFGNGSSDGTVLAGNFRFVMENSIVAFGTEGPGVASHYDYAELACCDIFGNAGGDWVGTIEDQYGIDGNIWEDPLFCDPESGNLHLAANSPCASENNPECGQIGAWGVGCGATAIATCTWGRIKALYNE